MMTILTITTSCLPFISSTLGNSLYCHKFWKSLRGWAWVRRCYQRYWDFTMRFTHVRNAPQGQLAAARRALALARLIAIASCSNQHANRVSIEPKREWLAINESYKSIDLSSMALSNSSFSFFIEASSSNVNRLATAIWQSQIQTSRSFW